DFPYASKRLAQAQRDLKWYDRDELYEGRGKPLSRRVVSEQMALLAASLPNAKPSSPKVFGRSLIEEVYAANVNAIVLESACRRVRRTEEWLTIATVLKAIKIENSAWADRWDVLDWDADIVRRDLEQAIAESESAITKAKAKLAEVNGSG